MSAAAFRAYVEEARTIGATVTRAPHESGRGPIVISGMLAEQLAKQLSVGADPGAVAVGGAEHAGRADALVRVVAGDPTVDDEQLVRAADARGTPVVLVQLWPQADWTRPFVLTPFVVECRAGEGFPIPEIADRIVEATGNGVALAARIPVVAPAVRAGLVKTAVVRSALIGLAGARYGASRPLLTLEQIRLLLQLRSVSTISDELPVRAGGAAAVAASGLALRGLARSLRSVVPAPLADAAVASLGTWALAKAYHVAEQRLLSDA